VTGGRTHRPAPVLRAHRFARAVIAAARRRTPGRAAAVVRRADPLGLVLQDPIRPVIRHHWDARRSLTLHWDIRAVAAVHRHLTQQPPASRTVWMPSRRPHEKPRPADASGPSRPPRIRALVQRATVQHSHGEHRAPAMAAPVTGPPRPGRAPGPVPRPGPDAVPLVHHQAQPPVGNPAGQPAEPVGQPGLAPAIRWRDPGGLPERADGHSQAALTVQDMPVVVDRVVREIDRRLVAARERRGWAG